MPARRRAFTLVELLVVIGIVAVLIAVLMPALARGREHANRIKCAANLRSMGQALTMYVQQYRHYPGQTAQEITTKLADVAVWPARLRPFLGGSREVFNCPSQDERCRWSDNGPSPVTRAVAGSRFVTFGYDPGEPLINSQTYFSYGYNGWGANGSMGSVADATHKGLGYSLSIFGAKDRHELPASRVRVAEDMIAIGDSTADGWGDFAIFALSETGGVHLWPGRVHAGGANVVFCDGHVTWYPQKDLIVDLTSDARLRPHKVRRWNNDHGLGDLVGD
jgi:prepilin-type processing-associated H-X9-DG protein/prepilin-type N-terminal cleavage/methylation domain-containing protein